MRTLSALCLLTFLVLAAPSRGDGDSDSLFQPAPGVRSDRAAGIGKRVQPGGVLELAALRGPGVIRHLWMTNVRQVEPAIQSGRVSFRIYWDNHPEPDLVIPLNEFFGRRFTDAPEVVFPMALGKNAYYPMPFRRAAKIELKNDSDVELWGIYWQIDYDDVERLPADAEYFGARTRIASPAPLEAPRAGSIAREGTGWLSGAGALLLAELRGPAVIRRIRLSSERETDADRVLVNRGVIVRIFWDGQPHASVDVPLGDFFGVGFGEDRDFRSAGWTQSGGEREILFPMPFKESARIELVNLAPKAAGRFTWRVDYERERDGFGRDGIEYFHACFRTSRPVPLNSTHVAMETAGRGKFVGLVWSCHWLNAEQKPEGTQNFWIDGRRIQSTGSEDYFGRAWGFGGEPDCHRYKGINLGPERSKSPGVPADWRRVTAYRAHVLDPIHFQKSLKLDFTCYGYNRGHRTDDYTTACFWYQSEPSLPLPALPPLEDLLPLDHPESLGFGLHQITQAEARRDFAAAQQLIAGLLLKYPHNPKAPDLRFKSGCALEAQGEIRAALNAFRAIQRADGGSEIGRDAADKIWLLERPGRLLLKAAAPSHAEIYVDGMKVTLPPAALADVPSWGHREIYRFTYPAFKVAWDSPSSAVMRLPAIRLETGPGRHILAAKASAGEAGPIFTPRVGYFFATLDVAGPDIVTDATWKISEAEHDGWMRPQFDDQRWSRAVEHPLSAFGDGAWTWLWPRGFRNFPGSMQRIWAPAIFREEKAFRETVWLRKQFEVR